MFNIDNNTNEPNNVKLNTFTQTLTERERKRDREKKEEQAVDEYMLDC